MVSGRRCWRGSPTRRGGRAGRGRGGSSSIDVTKNMLRPAEGAPCPLTTTPRASNAPWRAALARPVGGDSQRNAPRGSRVSPWSQKCSKIARSRSREEVHIDVVNLRHSVSHMATPHRRPTIRASGIPAAICLSRRAMHRPFDLKISVKSFAVHRKHFSVRWRPFQFDFCTKLKL